MEDNIIQGIYKITNPSGRIYIGKSIDIYKRWNQYKSLRCISQPKLYWSLKKYGVDNHIFEIQEIYTGDDGDILSEMELKWYEHYRKNANMLNCVIPNTPIKIYTIEEMQEIAKELNKRNDEINEFYEIRKIFENCESEQEFFKLISCKKYMNAINIAGNTEHWIFKISSRNNMYSFFVQLKKD